MAPDGSWESWKQGAARTQSKAKEKKKWKEDETNREISELRHVTGSSVVYETAVEVKQLVAARRRFATPMMSSDTRGVYVVADMGKHRLHALRDNWLPRAVPLRYVPIHFVFLGHVSATEMRRELGRRCNGDLCTFAFMYSVFVARYKNVPSSSRTGTAASSSSVTQVPLALRARLWA